MNYVYGNNVRMGWDRTGVTVIEGLGRQKGNERRALASNMTMWMMGILDMVWGSWIEKWKDVTDSWWSVMDGKQDDVMLDPDILLLVRCSC